MQIRLAVPADAPALARMRFAFRDSMGQAVDAEAEFVERCAAWMAPRLDSGTAWRAWVAEDADEIRAQLWLQLIEKVPNPGPELEWHAYVTNVFVDPAARGHGAAEQLIAAAVAFCRAQGVDSVILWPTERSRTLYARNGFEMPTDMMELVLDSGREIH